MPATGEVAFWALAAIALAGALTVVLTREVMRLALGLGAFLAASAGLFLLFGTPFLAAAQVFVYVGGVLVLVLFAIMLLRRSSEGEPSLGSRHDLLTAAVCAAVGGFVGFALLRDAAPVPVTGNGGGTAALAAELLGPLLPHFEMLGVLLLAALVGALTIVGGERR